MRLYLMSAFAYPSLGVASVAATVVLSLRHGIQVIWVYAAAHSAPMIDGQSLRNWSFEEFVRDAMRWPSVPTAKADHSIARAIAASCHLSSPKPAPRIRFWHVTLVEAIQNARH